MPTVVKECALCGQTKKLIESHIIPRAVVQWLKDTSATGRLRRASQPDQPLQDGLKEYLMCADCDNGLFGPKEKRFMETMFKPYQIDNEIELSYDADFHYFAASLAFRVIILEKAWHVSRDGVDFNDFEIPLNSLRRYLLGLTSEANELENYVTLTANGEDTTLITETSDGLRIQHGLGGMGFDLMRGMDIFAINLNGHLVTFLQMPGFLFATALKPPRYRGPLGTLISITGGTLSLDFGDFIASDLFSVVEERSRRLDGIFMSEAKAEKLEQMILKNPARWEKSETARLAKIARLNYPRKIEGHE